MDLVALPQTVRGLPLHVLVVHAVVVLVPLVAIGTLIVALAPSARRHFGALLVLGALGATILAPIATGSGENLAQRLGAGELVRDHSRWGERILPTMIVLLVLLVALVLLDILRRTTPAPVVEERELETVGAVAAGGSGSRPGTATRSAGGGRGGRATLAAPAPADEARLTFVDRWVGARMPQKLRSVSAQLWTRRSEAVVAVLCIAIALVALYVCFQTGESGAKAVWSGQ
jgi:uncharacterized membrane protein